MEFFYGRGGEPALVQSFLLLELVIKLNTVIFEHQAKNNNLGFSWYVLSTVSFKISCVRPLIKISGSAPALVSGLSVR